MPQRNNEEDWRIEAFERRQVEALDILWKRVESLELWRAKLEVKVALFASLFSGAGTVAVEVLVHWFKVK